VVNGQQLIPLHQILKSNGATMRVTLTIDDHLAGILRWKSRKLDTAFKAPVNSTLRKGLLDFEIPIRKVRAAPHGLGSRPGWDPDRMHPLVDELEAQDYLRKAAKDGSANCRCGLCPVSRLEMEKSAGAKQSV
jgi:hypothetical protein